MKILKKRTSAESGQAMLMIVMILGATMLGVTTIAGYITLQKLRTVTDIVDSTRAIYVADTGLEWWLYKTYSSQPNAASSTQPDFSDAEDTVELEVRDFGNSVRSIGHVNRAYRAFELFSE